MALTSQRPSTTRTHKCGEVETHKPARAVVRLSVDIPQPLMRELKVRAAADGTTIQSIVLRLLQGELSGGATDGQPSKPLTPERK